MNSEDLDKQLVAASENGHTISPILPEGVKNYLIDIDGTICDDIPNEEPERMLTAEVYPDALVTLNKWYDEGHIICFFTSVGIKTSRLRPGSRETACAACKLVSLRVC